jgi:ribosomal protein L32E
MCNCKKKGLRHWWKYLRLRLYWRNFWARQNYRRRVVDGEEVWVLGELTIFGFWPSGACYTHYPGPNITRDEHEHWYGG